MSEGRVRPRMATIAVSALIALSGAAQWQALYAQARARDAAPKNRVSTIMGCVHSPAPDSVRGTAGSYFANGVFTVRSIKETSGTCR